MTAGTETWSSWKCFARHAMAGGLLACTTGCVIIVRNLEITRSEPEQLDLIIAAPGSHQSAGGVKQTVKLQYEDGTSVLFRGSVLVAGDTLAGKGLRASPDAFREPVAVSMVPRKGIVGAVTFRERTNAGASVAVSVVGTVATLAAVGFIAMSMADAWDRAVGEALGCALGSFGYATCSLSPTRMLAPLHHGSGFRGGGPSSPAGGLRSPGQPQRGRHQ